VTELSSEDVVHRYLDAHVTHDDKTLGNLRDPDWTAEWPQTGERVRGHANDVAIMDNWPGGRPSAAKVRVVGSEDRWVITPVFTFHRVVGSGDFWWAVATSSYPDGSTSFAVAMLELRNGKVHRETWYFASPLDPPEWRARWVERIAEWGDTQQPRAR
jgi:hypothetical protein